jgi:DNA-3-methyladenine glycosylase
MKHGVPDIFQLDAISLAKRLLGMRLKVGDRSIYITETESYLNEDDKASHARFGMTKRSSILYERGGTVYVFMIYGMHYCVNIIAGEEGYPSAVLIRGGRTEDGTIIQGPGRVCRYLGIDIRYNGEDCRTSNHISIEEGFSVDEDSIKDGPRIGVAYAKEWAYAPLRFWI